MVRVSSQSPQQLAVTGYKDATNVCKSCLKLRTVGAHMGCPKEHHAVGGELDGPPMNKMISGGRVTSHEGLSNSSAAGWKVKSSSTHIFYHNASQAMGDEDDWSLFSL
jgi:hypothetical protein